MVLKPKPQLEHMTSFKKLFWNIRIRIAPSIVDSCIGT